MLASESFARHVVGTRFEDLTAEAVEQAKIFILDTIGVGISGSSAVGIEAVVKAAARWGSGDEAVVWGWGRRLPAPAAAMINGCQTHCQEFDCVHEGAVLHPMTTLLPAALAFAEREGGISGRDLITAVAVGVDLSATLGLASRSKMRFFRPAVAGGFGATAAVGKLMGLDEATLARTFGIQYSQTAGTLQPHIEGSLALPLQVGMNGRGGILSCDLAAAGVVGPLDTFEGEYGYFKLFEGEYDLAPLLAELGKRWRIAEVSHKPYPAGRVTHAGIEGLLVLAARHKLTADLIRKARIVAPPVTVQLCARPDKPGLTPTYARLCMTWLAAKALLRGTPDISHARGTELDDAATHELASRISLVADAQEDPNALMPVSVTVTTTDGRALKWRSDAMLGSPDRRLSREAHLAKFQRCCDYAAVPVPDQARADLIGMVDDLETVSDVRRLLQAFA